MNSSISGNVLEFYEWALGEVYGEGRWKSSYMDSPPEKSCRSSQFPGPAQVESMTC